METLDRAVISKHSMAILLFMLFLAGCQTQDEEQGAESEAKSNRVVAASYALQYLTERIAGELVTVEFPAADSDDPKNWSPSVAEVVAMQDADLFVINGLGARYAEWLTQVSIDESKLCNSVQNFQLNDYLKVNDYQIVHSHGPQGEHSHAYFVPYCWLDPNLASQQSAAICESLCAVYPEFETEFRSNLKLLETDLGQLEEVTAEFRLADKKPAICISPYLKIFARSLELGDHHLLYFSAADIKDLDELKANLIREQKEADASVVLTHFKLSPKIQECIDQCGLQAIEIDLLDKPGVDFIEAMKRNVEILGRLRVGLPN